MGVEIKDGTGRVRVLATPSGSLCDGEFNTVTGMCLCEKVTQLRVCEVLRFMRLHPSVSQRHGAIRITVDSVSEQEAAPLVLFSTTLNTLHIGGKLDPRWLIKIYKHTF